MDESGPKQQTLEQLAREFVGGRGIPGDLVNNIEPMPSMLSEQELWHLVKPIDTYEGYFNNNKLAGNLPLAEAVIAASDHKLVAEYNDLVEQINKEIGTGVTTQEQVDKILPLTETARKLVYGK